LRDAVRRKFAMSTERTSALSASHQVWKLWLAVMWMVAGLLVSDSSTQTASSGLSLLRILGGIGLTFFAGWWLVFSVRCPRCEAKWYLIALTQDSALKILTGGLTLAKCPHCGYPDGATPS
jgi:hypothetical protein